MPGHLVAAEIFVPGSFVATEAALLSIGWKEPGDSAEPVASGEAARGKTCT